MGRRNRHARSHTLPDLALLGDLQREFDRRAHKRNASLHAHNRAAERYNVHYDAATRARIVDAIQNGRSTFVERGRGQRVVHDVTLGTKVVRVLWDRRLREIVTFLPRPEQ